MKLAREGRLEARLEDSEELELISDGSQEGGGRYLRCC